MSALFHIGSTTPRFLQPELLLHPQLPPPLHGLNPRTILGAAWWDWQRERAYAENNQCCWTCGVNRAHAPVHRWLEGHESYKLDWSNGIAELVEVVALCYMCHAFIHRGRASQQVASGEMTEQLFQEISRHGRRVLRHTADPAALKAIEDRINDPDWFPQGSIAPWPRWRLIVDGREYSLALTSTTRSPASTEGR
jgi:hypothetical protein